MNSFFVGIILITITLTIRTNAEEDDEEKSKEKKSKQVENAIRFYQNADSLAKKANGFLRKDPFAAIIKEELTPIRDEYGELIDTISDFDESLPSKKIKAFLKKIKLERNRLKEEAGVIKKYQIAFDSLQKEYQVFAEKLQKIQEKQKDFKNIERDMSNLNILEKFNPQTGLDLKRLEFGSLTTLDVLKSIAEDYKMIENHEEMLDTHKNIPMEEWTTEWIEEVRNPAKLGIQFLESKIKDSIKKGRDALEHYYPFIISSNKIIEERGLNIVDKFNSIHKRWAESTNEIKQIEIDIDEEIERLENIANGVYKQMKKKRRMEL